MDFATSDLPLSTPMDVPVFCGAVLGTAVQSACVRLAATAAIRRLPATTTVFVVCQDSLLRSSRLTLAHA